MKVFHYCAEVLGKTPLFESIKDVETYRQGHLSQEGSVYNDFDNDPLDLLLDSDESDGSEDEGDGDLSDSANDDRELEDLITEVDVDRAYLKADKENNDRWFVDHALFDGESEKDSKEYMQKVHDLLSGDFDELPIYDDMEYR